MNGETIKEFLVGLGFDIDESSLKKFNKAIAEASLKVIALGTVITASAGAVFAGISKISDSFEQMGYEFRLIAPTINKVLYLRRALLASYSAAGINILYAVQQSLLFNLSLTKTRYALEAIYKSVGLKFLPRLTKQMDIFRAKIYKNMPKIQSALESFVKFIFKAFDATVQLGSRLWSILGRIYDFFVKLDDVTGGWSTKILAAAAAWKYLNLEFLATPLGLLITGLTTILALYDDFKTQQEGGKSLFDWKTGPLKAFVDLLSNLRDIVVPLAKAFADILNGDWSKLKSDIQAVASAIANLDATLDKLVRSFGFKGINKLLAWRDSVDSGVINAFKNDPYANGNANINGDNSGTLGPLKPFPFAPTGGGVDYNLKSSTTINVNATSDPNATAVAVAGQQSGVNRNLVRNLRPVVV